MKANAAEPTPLNLASSWAALLGLACLFDLPVTLTGQGPVLSRLRPSGEFLLLLTLGAATYALRRGRPLRIALALIAALLLLVRLDQIIFCLILNEDPLLYDQLFMVRHALVLVSDLFSPAVALGFAGLLLATALLLWSATKLFSIARPLVARAQRAHLLKVGAALWLLYGAATAAHALGLSSQPIVQWMTPALARNIEESVRTYERVQKGLDSSPYASFASVALEQRPDVMLLLVESYGRIMATHPQMRPSYLDALGRLREHAQKAGFGAVTGYSVAPVSGGRSWLAAGSIIMGAHVKYEAMFSQLLSEPRPNLVSFFAHHGYEAILLAPSDRKRPGISGAVNRYGFTQVISGDSLPYRGPAFGWGRVPDQYALEYTEEHVLNRTTRPVFLDFQMTSSHAHWDNIPPLVEDYRELEHLNAKSSPSLDKSSPRVVLRRSRYFARAEGGIFPYAGALTERLGRHYAGSVLYCLELLGRFVERRTKDAVIIIMGDHQPPVISAETRSMDVPIHVLSRDPRVLAALEAHGLKRGFFPPSGAATLRHEGLYSLIVRTLAALYGPTGAPLPAYLPNGLDI